MSQIPRAQLDQSLAVPGLAVTPPVSAGVAQAEELFRSIGMIGATVGRIGQMAEQKTASIEAGLRGQAAMDIKSQLPEFEQKIVNGELDNMFTDLGEGETVHGRVESYLNDRLGEVPEAYREEVMKYAPTMTQALVNRQQKIIDENKAVVGATILEGTATATSALDLEALAFGYSEATGESMARSKMRVVDALATVAQQTGDTKRMKLLEEFGGNTSPATVAITRDRVDAKVREAENQARIDQNRAIQNLSATSIDKGNLDTALEDLDNLAKAMPNADADVIAMERRRIQTAITQRNEQAFIAAANALDRSNLPADQYQDALGKKAQQLGIPADAAHALNNQRIIDRAGELANVGDIDAVKRLGDYMVRPSSQEREMFSDAVAQTERKKAQLDAERAEQEFRVNKQRTEAAIIGEAMSAYRAGANLAAVVPADDVVVQIGDREVTFHAAALKKQMHATAIAEADSDFFQNITKTDPRSVPFDALYADAVAQMGGGPAGEANLNEARIKDRALLVYRTGMPDPDFKRQFATGSHKRITPGTTAEELGPETEQLGNLFRMLDQMKVAKDHMDPATYDLFEAAHVAVASGFAPTFNDGLVAASNPPQHTDDRYGFNDPDFIETVNAELENMGVDETMVGPSRSTILSYANSAIKIGAFRGPALEAAIAAFKRDNIVIDGAPVYHNGVGASENGTRELFGVLKDYAEFRHKDKIDNLPNGKDGLFMSRDPFTGTTMIMDKSGHGQVILSLSDDQVKTLAAEVEATNRNTTEFYRSIEAQDRSRRWAENRPTVGELPGIAFRTTMALADVEGHIEGNSLGERIAPGAGKNVAIAPPKPPTESSDPTIRDIGRFMMQRAAFKKGDEIMPKKSPEQEAKMLEINTRR